MSHPVGIVVDFVAFYRIQRLTCCPYHSFLLHSIDYILQAFMVFSTGEACYLKMV